MRFFCSWEFFTLVVSCRVWSRFHGGEGGTLKKARSRGFFVVRGLFTLCAIAIIFVNNSDLRKIFFVVPTWSGCSDLGVKGSYACGSWPPHRSERTLRHAAQK